ncbi:hypothetical protein SLEP1_g24889 [Rubroshorea leprosula]|uniref:Uncharacterized protein n=1 Tax=Rubroshorea leprosula TaxID=152421 RepID=A0AAV5JUD6_9ROSI|nr:hypothetical protein SLEP1_g24889 [Rubroshorea leprosula]
MKHVLFCCILKITLQIIEEGSSHWETALFIGIDFILTQRSTMESTPFSLHDDAFVLKLIR